MLDLRVAIQHQDFPPKATKLETHSVSVALILAVSLGWSAGTVISARDPYYGSSYVTVWTPLRPMVVIMASFYHGHFREQGHWRQEIGVDFPLVDLANLHLIAAERTGIRIS